MSKRLVSKRLDLILPAFTRATATSLTIPVTFNPFSSVRQAATIAQLLPPEGVADGGVAWLRHFSQSYGRCSIWLSPTRTGEPLTTGPTLVDSWTTHPQAIVITRLGDPGLVLPLPGPAAPGVSPPDTIEPYEWRLPSADQTRLRAWTRGHQSSSRYTLTLNW